MKPIVWQITGQPSPFIQQKLEGLIQNEWDVFLITPHPDDYASISENRISKKQLDKQRWTLANFFRIFLHLTWVIKTAKFYRTTGQHDFLDGVKIAVAFLPLVQKKKPQLIHVQWLYETYLFAPLAQRWGIPLLVSIRGSQANYYLDTTKNGKLKFSINAPLATHFHTVGSEIAHRMQQEGVPVDKLTTLYNGINPNIFSEGKQELTFSLPLKLITVGNYHPRKNHSASISLMMELEKAGVDYQWSFIGEGEDQLKFQYLVNSLPISSARIHFFQNQSLEEMAKHYQNSHFLLSFSTSEGLCNGVLEAMACGCVPLVFDATGMKELIDPEVNGSILPWGDVLGMRDDLLKFIQGEKSWWNNRKEALHKAKKFPNQDTSTLNWIHLYQKLMGGEA